MIVMLAANYAPTVKGTAFSFESSQKAIVLAEHSTFWGGATGSIARDVRGNIIDADDPPASHEWIPQSQVRFEDCPHRVWQVLDP
jgi:hypothetical protein